MLFSLCMNILRTLASQLHSNPGAAQRLKHTSPDLHRDIATVMESLAERKVYEVDAGGVLDYTDKPVVDIVAEGMNALAKGVSSPLKQSNESFTRLQVRCDQTLVYTLL